MKNHVQHLKNLAQPVIATALFSVVALSGCSAPEAAGAPLAAGQSVSPSATPSASPTPSSGPYGDFASAAEACSTISQQATGASLLPMSAAQGKTAELEQYKAELATTAQRVPTTLKADFTRLKDTAIAGLSDQSVYSSGKFAQAMAPVSAWLKANCS